MQITVTLSDLSGAALPGSTLSVQLAGYGSMVPRVKGVALFGDTISKQLQANANGLVSFTVTGNDVILPQGTYYTVQVADPSGNIVQTNAYILAGTANLDLSNLTPINFAPVILPVPVPVSPQFVRLAWSQSVVLPTVTQNIVTYALVLTGDVLNFSLSMQLPGQLVGVLLQQDAVGNHRCALSAIFKNAQQPASFANSKTFQCFMTADDGFLYPFGAVSVTV